MLAVLGVAACGGDSAADVVVRVAGMPIRRAAVQHWMSVIAAEASTAPGQPKEQPPQPPGDVACIAYMRAYGAKMVDPIAHASSAQLKGRCEHEYRKMKLKALYAVIVYAWVTGEAAELGVHATSAELSRSLAAFNSQFPTRAALESYLAGTGATHTDLVQNLEQGLLIEKIEQHLEAARARRHLPSAALQRERDTFGAAFKARWTSRTSCSPGYVVPLCRQYKTPSTPPELVPPAVPLTNQPAGG
jgi:hypothetical protein